MDLIGFGFSGYRSFSSGERQALSPLSKVNLLAGQNNAGKSNVLRFAQNVLGALGPGGGGSPVIDGLDSPLRGARSPDEPEIAIALYIGTDEVAALFPSGRNTLRLHKFRELERALGVEPLRPTPGGELWFRYRPQVGKRASVNFSVQWLEEVHAAQTNEMRAAIAEASRELTGQSAGGRIEDLARVLGRFDALARIPRVETVEAFRQVRESADGGAAHHSGANLVSALARLERPIISDLNEKERFQSINRFVQSVLEDESVQLEIPHDRSTIYVSRSGLTLPLESLGTGVHQVVILAAAANLLQGHLVCIEEPEIHLHPLLQRKLLRYLSEETDNTYLIATHSAHMLDAELATIFHVTMSGSGSKVHLAATPRDRAAICNDLGYRPSDLVQTNAAIWVEGPSDRLYIRHWISLLDPTLTEGVHYSIMFYGGRLLNHLSANDPDIDDFISLRRLNRHIAIVIDSDKRARQTRINSTKRRVEAEFSAGPGFAWTTKGYTIENYVPPRVLREAVAATHKGAKLEWSGELYVDPLAHGSLVGIRSQPDKIAIARACVERWQLSAEWPLDLRRCVSRAVRFVREANGLAPTVD